MAGYIELPTSRKDGEEHRESEDDDCGSLPHPRNASASSYRQEASSKNRFVVVLVAVGLLLLIVASTGYHWANWVRHPRTFFGPPPSDSTATEFRLRQGNVPGPAEVSPYTFLLSTQLDQEGDR